MKRLHWYLFAFLLSLKFTYAQVGIGTTSPKAMLDISATNSVTPTNTDGVLIPRIDKFPTTNPTAAQKSMLVYLTTTDGTDVPGFYYWDGTNWVCITCPSSSSGGHYIGEKFGGGIIFYLDEDRQHGLIASLKDLGPATGTKWKYKGTNTNAKSAYDGASNTATIMAITPVQNGSAAKLCYDYTGEGKTDWYLPAIWELNQLYNSARIINEVLENDGDPNTTPLYYNNPNLIYGGKYWSSTENWDTGVSKFALAIRFDEGMVYASWKADKSGYGLSNVRAIRKF